MSEFNSLSANERAKAIRIRGFEGVLREQFQLAYFGKISFDASEKMSYQERRTMYKLLIEQKQEAPVQQTPVEEVPAQEAPQQPAFGLGDIIGTVMGGAQQTSGKRAKKSETQKMAERAASQAANTVAREVTKGIMRGLFGQMK